MSDGSTGTSTAVALRVMSGSSCAFERRRRVDDQAFRIERQPRGEAARYARVALVAGDAVNRRLALGALAEPARARSLRIQVHQRGLEPADGEVTDEIDRDRGFARTTLGIEENDLLHAGRHDPI